MSDAKEEELEDNDQPRSSVSVQQNIQNDHGVPYHRHSTPPSQMQVHFSSAQYMILHWPILSLRVQLQPPGTANYNPCKTYSRGMKVDLALALIHLVLWKIRVHGSPDIREGMEKAQSRYLGTQRGLDVARCQVGIVLEQEVGSWARVSSN